jgi:hypothetical protein
MSQFSVVMLKAFSVEGAVEASDLHPAANVDIWIGGAKRVLPE